MEETYIAKHEVNGMSVPWFYDILFLACTDVY